MNDYPDYVPKDETPDATVENIPNEVVERAISITCSYKECAECGARQWFAYVPGRNSEQDCCECGEVNRLVG